MGCKPSIASLDWPQLGAETWRPADPLLRSPAPRSDMPLSPTLPPRHYAAPSQLFRAAPDEAAPEPPSPRPILRPDRRRVTFCEPDQPLYELLMFAPIAITFGRDPRGGPFVFRSACNLWQALKFNFMQSPALVARIAAAPEPYLAQQIARANARLQRSEWSDERFKRLAMRRIVQLKATQHPHVARLLLSTGDLELVFAFPDDFWGAKMVAGHDGETSYHGRLSSESARAM